MAPKGKDGQAKSAEKKPSGKAEAGDGEKTKQTKGGTAVKVS